MTHPMCQITYPEYAQATNVDNEFLSSFVHPIATNLDIIPPTIKPNDHANKLATPEINVTSAYASIELRG